MRHGAGHRKAAGDCGPCDRHVRSGAESPQDSARPFENAHLSSGDSGSEQKLGTCSVDINWGGLFGNVLAGLAAVGAVALTLATFGAAGPIIVGAVIGGSMAVGMVAVGDVISGEVSDVSTYVLEGLKGAATGAVFAGLGVAGQAISKTIGCISTAGKVINVTAKVSGGLSVALGGFDITAFIAGAFAPGNPYTQLNQRLNSNKLYTGFVFAVDAISIFTMGASSSMKCFVAGTLIHTPFGLAAIETIKTGDQVISTNPETFKVAEKKVVETFVRETNELVHLTINDELIQTTPDHPFYVKNRGFVNAVELQIGDELLDSVGNALIVEDTILEICVPAVTVYNFEVEDFHTYHVGMLGILVHNANYAPRRPATNVIKKEQHTDGSITYTKMIDGKEVSVKYSPDGYPDFSPYTHPDYSKPVEINYTGNRRLDEKQANAALKLPKKPDGYTWHHLPDGKGMILVDEIIHGSKYGFPHTGGFSIHNNS